MKSLDLISIKLGFTFAGLNIMFLFLILAMGDHYRFLLGVFFPETIFFPSLAMLFGFFSFIVIFILTFTKAFLIGFTLHKLYLKLPRWNGRPIIFSVIIIIFLITLSIWATVAKRDLLFASITERVQASTTVEHCQKYFKPRASSHFYTCILHVAVLNNDITACNVIESADGHPDPERCYLAFAEYTSQPEICDTAPLSLDKKYSCYHIMRRCEDLKDVKQPGTSRSLSDFCWQDKAYKEQESNFCKNIREPDRRKKCLDLVG